MSIPNHYEILGVARNSPAEVIRAAYKVLSQKYHPDKNPGQEEMHQKMAQINEAYNVLSDPALREEYDVILEKSDQADKYEAAARAYFDFKEAVRKERIRRMSETTEAVASQIRGYLPQAKAAATSLLPIFRYTAAAIAAFIVAIFVISLGVEIYKDTRPESANYSGNRNGTRSHPPPPPDSYNPYLSLVQPPQQPMGQPSAHSIPALIDSIENAAPELNPRSHLYDQAAVDWIERKRRTYANAGWSDFDSLTMAYDDFRAQSQSSQSASNSPAIPSPPKVNAYRSVSPRSTASRGCEIKSVMTDSDYRACGINPPQAQ